MKLLQQLETYFGPDRWSRLLKQMAMRGLEPQALADHITSIRGHQHAGNDAAWTVQAAHHALILCGSVPGPQDHKRLQDTLTTAPAATASSKPAKRGGKHDPAPPAN